MHTKCVLTVQIIIEDANYPFNLKKATYVIRGTMHTKCALTIPLININADIPLNLKKVTFLLLQSMQILN